MFSQVLVRREQREEEGGGTENLKVKLVLAAMKFILVISILILALGVQAGPPVMRRQGDLFKHIS